MADVFDFLDPDIPRLPGAHCDAVWEAARDDYLAGASASVVCERHGLSRSRFFERAKAEGWRRQDRAEEQSAHEAEADAAFLFEALERPAASAYVLARRAWAMAELALSRRRRLEAQGWVRLARDLRKMAVEEAGGVTWARVVSLNEPPPPAPRDPEQEAQTAEDLTPPVHRPSAPLSVLSDRKRLSAWMSNELGFDVEALAAGEGAKGERPDSPDQSRRTPPPLDPSLQPRTGSASRRHP